MSKHLLLSVLLLSAAFNSAAAKDETSPFYAVAKGSQLSLNHVLIIQPSRASIIIQNGNVVTNQTLDIYQPNCVFEINTLAETPITIEPDNFLITKVDDEIMSVSLHLQQFASLAMFSSDASSDFNYATTMYLQSKQQPDVLRISCMHWEAGTDDNFLTIKQMRQAMGSVFTLNLLQ